MQQGLLPNSVLFGGTVLPNCMLFGRTVPTNGVLFGWTVLANSFPLIVYQILKSSGTSDICFKIKTIRGSYSEKFLKLYQLCQNLLLNIICCQTILGDENVGSKSFLSKTFFVSFVSKTEQA